MGLQYTMSCSQCFVSKSGHLYAVLIQNCEQTSTQPESKFSFKTLSRPLHSQIVSLTYSIGSLGKRSHAGHEWALQFNATMGISTIRHGGSILKLR